MSVSCERASGRRRSRMAQIAHHDVDVAALVAAADIVFLADPAARHDQVERPRVVLDIEPVAHIRARAIDRQRLAVNGVEDDQRNELLGEVIGAVIVRAVRDQRREAVGARPGRDEVIGRRLRGRIGRARIIGRLLDERALVAERAVDLVGRDMQEAEAVPPRLRAARANRRAPPRAARTCRRCWSG